MAMRSEGSWMDCGRISGYAEGRMGEEESGDGEDDFNDDGFNQGAPMRGGKKVREVGMRRSAGIGLRAKFANSGLFRWEKIHRFAAYSTFLSCFLDKLSR